jgi:hypothetical protein
MILAIRAVVVLFLLMLMLLLMLWLMLWLLFMQLERNNFFKCQVVMTFEK